MKTIDLSRDRHLPALAYAILTGPTRLFGYQLYKDSGLRGSTVYILLTRLVEAGWLTDGWETEAEAQNPRYPRRYYVVTDEGREMLRPLSAVTLP